MARSAKPWWRKDRRIWQVTIDGIRHNLGPDKAEAMKQFHALMREPKKRAVSSLVFASMADAFLEWLLKHRAPDTFEWYRYRIERFCQRYPDLKVEDLRPFHVQQWVDSYPNLARTSRRNYVRAVKRCVNWAYRQGHIENDPIRNLEVPSAESREVHLNREQFEQLLEFVIDEPFRLLCVVTFECGCRPQELLRVEARHFDSARSRWVFPIRDSKGRRQPRVVYLSPKAEEITRQLVALYPEGKLFRNSNGRPWTTDAVNCAFSRLHRRMGRKVMEEQGTDLKAAIHEELKKKKDKRCPDDLKGSERQKFANRAIARFATRCSLYALRHSWATAALQSGLDGLTVGILLGHNDPSTLSRVYQHLSHNPEHLLSEARRTVRS